MTREELIAHLEHLAEYVKYSEDAPAIMEVIEMLKTHEERTETHACDLPQSTMGQVNDTVQSTNDCISRQAAIDEIDEWIKAFLENGHKESAADACLIQDGIIQLPSAQPEPISEAYAKAARTWLVQYQIKCAELQGRYTPYEVLGWIVNDWRKDNGIDGINQ